MNPSDLRWATALELSELIQTRAISPVEVAELLLAEIDAANPVLNAFLTVTAELAIEQARAAEARAHARARLGPMDGVPYTLKDLEPTRGVRTTMGSKWFEDFVPDADSVLAARLRASGGVLLGKTNTPQYGYNDSGENLLGPPCVNPWDLARTPGGSSAGAAVAVATGLGPLGQGSDGAGSIRIPASLCGVVGMKPSFGRIPDVPSGSHWTAYAHSGPLARTVRDAALLLGVMAGPDARSPLSIDATPRDYVAECDLPTAGLRVAVSADLGYAPVDPEVRSVFLAAADDLRHLGWEIAEEDPGWFDPAPGFKLFNAVVCAAEHGERVRSRPDWAEPDLRDMISEGERASGIEFQKTEMARSEFYGLAADFFSRWDLLVTPTMPVAAWPAGPTSPTYPVKIDGRTTPHLIDHLPFTFPFNMTGQPAISVPAGLTRGGLPVGLQIVGRWHEDHVVLSAAAAFEAARPWSHQRPEALVSAGGRVPHGEQ
jgi:Asp-tRNA(Asn)/Glu-tRNA(Gln) amidotransferase A subunit family amidase